jgi:hypothetical protein
MINARACVPQMSMALTIGPRSRPLALTTGEKLIKNHRFEIIEAAS